jgi:hypothetical protein
MGMRLGRNPCPISTLSGFHHCDSQQGVQTDSWEICACVQLYVDECKETNLAVHFNTEKDRRTEYSASY